MLDNPFLAARAEQRHLIDTEAYATIRPYKKSRSKRHAETFYKFEAFRNFGYEQNIFIDSDILCLAATPQLTRLHPKIGAARDSGFRPTRGYRGHPDEINSGVLRIPSAYLGSATVTALRQLARENPGRSGYNSGDQGILNKWIRHHQHPLDILPTCYNHLMNDPQNDAYPSDAKLLHFTAKKPWFTHAEPLPPIVTLWRDLAKLNTAPPPRPTAK